ncbi:MAG: transposase [Gammaproteobacteria bacterium]|jgi:transposase
MNFYSGARNERDERRHGAEFSHSLSRKRLNIQGALDLETFQFTLVEGEKINAQTTQQMLEKLERNNPTMTAIHVFLDNARYHHAKILQPWLESFERRVKLHFLPPCRSKSSRASPVSLAPS